MVCSPLFYSVSFSFVLLYFFVCWHASQADNVVYEEGFVTSRELKLFTCVWKPVNQEPKALIFFCHGYGMECSTTMNSTARRLVQAGYAMYGIDYEGHGKSAGLQGYVESFDNVVNDVSNHYTSICEKKENRKKLRILMGESMGGAVALLVHRKKPEYWDGAVLVAPMCKIADEMKPSPMVVNALLNFIRVIPTWKVIPSNDIIDSAIKVPEVREQVRANQYCYKGRLRLKTGFELLRVSTDIERNLNEVSLPFLVLHGEDDKVTDKSASKQLYEVASSKDKTLKLYPGMWHSLLYGETLENIEIVLSDIIGWLNEKVASGNARLEKELKNENDKQTCPSGNAWLEKELKNENDKQICPSVNARLEKELKSENEKKTVPLIKSNELRFGSEDRN